MILLLQEENVEGLEVKGLEVKGLEVEEVKLMETFVSKRRGRRATFRPHFLNRKRDIDALTRKVKSMMVIESTCFLLHQVMRKGEEDGKLSLSPSQKNRPSDKSNQGNGVVYVDDDVNDASSDGTSSSSEDVVVTEKSGGKFKTEEELEGIKLRESGEKTGSQNGNDEAMFMLLSFAFK